jgi:hypothetical protein
MLVNVIVKVEYGRGFIYIMEGHRSKTDMYLQLFITNIKFHYAGNTH